LPFAKSFFLMLAFHGILSGFPFVGNLTLALITTLWSVAENFIVSSVAWDGKTIHTVIHKMIPYPPKCRFSMGIQHHLSTLSTKANRENDETDYSQRQIDNQNCSYRQ
jgi:hypothetical protein